MYFCNPSFSTIVLAIFRRSSPITSAIFMPNPLYFRQILQRVRLFLARLSFRTGLWLLAACAVSYLLAFAPILFPLSLTTKGVLWFIFFGLAKALQYSAVLVLGKAGGHRLRDWWRRRNFLASPTSQQSEETQKEKEEHQK